MEKAGGLEGADQSSPLPLTPVVPPNLTPELVDLPKRSIISRHGVGNHGRRITLLTNHFKVSVNASDAIFYQYTVTISVEDRKVTESKNYL